MKEQRGQPQDIDAMFEHMIQDLEHSLEDVCEWSFDLRSPEFEKLESLAEGKFGDFAEEFGETIELRLQERVEEITEEGGSVVGPPLLSAVITDALNPDQVKALAARFRTLAETEGVTYEGVSCFEPFDEEELFGWLDLEEAKWRLRHHTDCGLEPDDDVPFVFAIEAEDSLDDIAQACLGEQFIIEEIIRDEEGNGVIIRCPGKNNEDVLTDRYQAAERVAGVASAELLGVQFFAEFEEDDESAS